MKKGERRNTAQALVDRLDQDTPGCWEWPGTLRCGGYAKLWFNGKNRFAHRVVYEIMVGQIPSGLTLDHLCLNRACVRPDHLEPVTQRVNNLRATTFSGENSRKTHCNKGHAFDTDNTRTEKAGAGYRRICKQCGRDRNKAWTQGPNRQRHLERRRARRKEKSRSDALRKVGIEVAT